MFSKNKQTSGYTLMELMIVLFIFASAGAIIFISLSGLQSKRRLQAGSEQVKADIYMMQSRAVTGLLKQRLVLEDAYTYRTEEDETGSGDWVTVEVSSPLPTDIAFTAEDVTDRATSLEFSSNGFPDFNGQPNDPFLTLIHEGAGMEGRFKEIHIDVSGRVEIQGN